MTKFDVSVLKIKINPRINFFSKFIGPMYPMEHTKSQGHWPFGSENFKGILPYIGVAASLIM